MSMANENAYMNATDISEEEDYLERPYEAQMRLQNYIRRNAVTAIATAFLAGFTVGALVSIAVMENR